MREKLIELLMDMPSGHRTYEETERYAEDVADYLIANGVTVQPVKVGDYVYYIKGGYYKEPEFCEVSRPCKVVEVTAKLQRNSGAVMNGFITDNGTRYSFNGIGKTVFLSHEEAVHALKKRKG